MSAATSRRSTSAVSGRTARQRAGGAAQLGGVRVDRRRPERDAPRGQHRDHALEVVDLLARDFGERPRELGVSGVATDEREGVRRRLELAVRVIDEDRVDVAHRRGRPRVVGRDLQTQHLARLFSMLLALPDASAQADPTAERRHGQRDHRDQQRSGRRTGRAQVTTPATAAAPSPASAASRTPTPAVPHRPTRNPPSAAPSASAPA